MSPSGCIPAPACQAALRQASELWPTRSRASDGICASDDHNRQNPNSDHATGNAFDLTHDPGAGVDNDLLAEDLKESGDTRIKYVIWNRRIWNPSITPHWRTYSGNNPHTKHMHVSIHAAARGHTAPWWSPKEKPMPADPKAYAQAVALTPTPTGKGYWILTADGGVYSFGDAQYYGRVIVTALPE